MHTATGPNCRMAAVFFIFAFCFFGVKTAFAQKPKNINVKADSSFFETKDGVEILRIKHHVVFTHEGAIMHCDSAYNYRKANSIDAFSNIHVNIGDSVHLYGDKMFYNGNTKELDIYGNVRLVDKEMVLESEALHYNRNSGIARYTTGGKVTNNQNVLVSNKGLYNSNTAWLSFKDSVVLTNPDYTMRSDTLLYHPELGLARFRGPTHIASDSGYINSTFGDYDTKNKVAYFSERSTINDRATTLIGDSIYFNQTLGYGQLYGHAYISDTVNNTVITGNYAEYQKSPERAFVTGTPIFTMITEGDSVFIYGDTLRITTNHLEQKKIKVSPNAQIFKSDLQGKCDSLTFSENDSTLRMYNAPVLWNGRSQLTADFIYLTLKHSALDSIYMIKNAFVLTQVDSVKFDQVRGKNMFGRFKNNQINALKVEGNGQTVYTVVDKEVQQGINRADCSDLIVRFKESEISQVIFINKPNAKMYPLNQIPEGELFLRGFNSRLDEKPNRKKHLVKYIE